MDETIQKLVAAGEGSSTEFKVALPPKSETYLKTVVAFSNGCGGTILFGINDKDHGVVGLDSDRLPLIQDSITNAIVDNCEPKIAFDVDTADVDGKTVLCVTVYEGHEKPYYLKTSGKEKSVYVRIAATSRKADPWKIKQLEYSCLPVAYDQTKLARKVSREEIEAVCDRLYRHACDLTRHDTEREDVRKISLRQLLSYKVVYEENNGFRSTPAFELLSGRMENFPEAQIRCAVFRGKDRSILVTKKNFDGPIDEQIENAYSFVLNNLKVGLYFDGLKRREMLELPEKSVREMIANAVCHRSYIYPEPIRVMLYDDRLEVVSPGMLAEGATIERMKAGWSRCQNKAIASVFRYLEIIEGWGTGIPLLFSRSREYGLPEPVIEEVAGSVLVALPRVGMNGEGGRMPVHTVKNEPPTMKPEALKQTPSLRGDGQNRRRKIVEYLKDHPQVSQNKAAAELKLPIITVKRDFAQLQKEGILQRIGNNRTGHWQIFEEPEK